MRSMYNDIALTPVGAAPMADDLSGVKLEPEDADTELSRAIERSRRLRQETEAQVSTLGCDILRFRLNLVEGCSSYDAIAS